MSENGNGRLTDKQAAFVEAYLGAAKFNATEAARLAGYDGNDNTLGSVGWENLQKPAIKARISQRLQETAMSADEVLKRFAEIARAEYTEFIGDRGHVDLVGLREAGKMHLVRGTRWDRDGNLVVTFCDPEKALELLGKYHALFTDRVEHSIPGGINVYLPENSRDE